MVHRATSWPLPRSLIHILRLPSVAANRPYPGCSRRPLPTINLGPTHPLPQRLRGSDPQLLRHRGDRGPLRPVRRSDLGHHPHRPLPQLRRIPANPISHDPDSPNLGSLRTRREDSKLLRQQADYCVALGSLVKDTELFEPTLTLVRTSLEYTVRAFWVLDPSVRHRQRCARAALMELVSLHHSRDAVSDLDDGPQRRAARQAAKGQWKRFVEVFSGLFWELYRDGDPARWSIEGSTYDSWTQIADDWSKMENTGVPGGALYKLLAVRAHPQGYVATPGLEFDVSSGDGSARTLAMEQVEWTVQLALASFYSALTTIASYHGFRSTKTDAWEKRIEATLPSVFVAAAQPPNY